MRSRQLQEQFDRHTEHNTSSESEEHGETASDRWFPECHLPPPAESRWHATLPPTASERAYCPTPAPPANTERIEAPLWARDEQGNPLPPSLDDIQQGQKSYDCYVMASLAALVQTHPDKIVKMIHDHGGGVYTVHFREPGWSYISPSVTTDFVKEKHAQLSPRRALWPLVIEKAYGQTKGRIENLDVGGSPAGVLRDMVDMQSNSFFVSQREPDAILATLAKAKDEGKAITVMSPTRPEASALQIQQMEQIPGLVPRHAYLVTDVDTRERKLKLFNPWGYNHPNTSGWLSLDDFKKFFVNVNVSG